MVKNVYRRPKPFNFIGPKASFLETLRRSYITKSVKYDKTHLHPVVRTPTSRLGISTGRSYRMFTRKLASFYKE